MNSSAVDLVLNTILPSTDLGTLTVPISIFPVLLSLLIPMVHVLVVQVLQLKI